jgi:RimJ/RimL family protein N-acetyltransferase
VIELRLWEETDAEALNEAVAASLDHLRPWMPWASEPPLSLAARRLWVAERRREADGGGDRHYGAFRDGAIVGAGGLHRRIGPGALEIGYWTAAAHVREGIATTIVHRLCALAFAQPSIGHVEIHHDAANAASGAVARRAGFTHVRDQAKPPAAPAESGVERVWRLARPAT